MDLGFGLRNRAMVGFFPQSTTTALFPLRVDLGFGSSDGWFLSNPNEPRRFLAAIQPSWRRFKFQPSFNTLRDSTQSAERIEGVVSVHPPLRQHNRDTKLVMGAFATAEEAACLRRYKQARRSRRWARARK